MPIFRNTPKILQNWIFSEIPQKWAIFGKILKTSKIGYFLAILGYFNIFGVLGDFQKSVPEGYTILKKTISVTSFYHYDLIFNLLNYSEFLLISDKLKFNQELSFKKVVWMSVFFYISENC